MSTVAILQARLGSSRFPGKVLADFVGEPLLQRVVKRVQRSLRLDQVVVATSTTPTDDKIEELCEVMHVPCFRGSEDDVLDRFVMAARQFDAQWIVRVNCDNPFLAPEFIDTLIEECRHDGVDYASYRVGERPAMLTATGLFSELVSRACLESASQQLDERLHREHVTLGIYQSPERYHVTFLDAPQYATDPRLRLTLDVKDDYLLLQEIASCLESDAPLTSQQLCEQILRNPTWLAKMEQLNTANAK